MKRLSLAFACLLLARLAGAAPADPSILLLAPDSITAGSDAFSMTVYGANFDPTMGVVFNGKGRLATFVSSTQLVTKIFPSDVLTPGIASVGVAGDTTVSSTVPFTIEGKAGPLRVTIDHLTPAVGTTGGDAFQLSVFGSGFTAGSAIRWDGALHPTTFVSPSEVQTTITADDRFYTGLIPVVVKDGSDLSNTVFFNLKPAPGSVPRPVIARLSPNSVTVGTESFSLIIDGINFDPSMGVRFNGKGRKATFISSTRLITTVFFSDLTNPGVVNVEVAGPSGVSKAVPFTIEGKPGPLRVGIIRLSPAVGAVRGGDFTLEVTGFGFTPGSAIRWNGLVHPTTFVSSALLRTTVMNSERQAAGSIPVVVLDGTDISNTLFFTMTGPDGGGGAAAGPSLDRLDPATATAGAPALTLVAHGSGFLSSSVLQWNGQDRPTTFVSASELQTQLGAADLAQAGSAQVAVFNPGGQVSPALTFTVLANDDIKHLRVYPNPWTEGRDNGADITFDRMPDGSTVKIFTVSGRWLRTLAAPGGTAVWDRRNDSGDLAASGYYFYLATDGSGHQTRGKLAIIK